ncbi:CAP Gly-rich domain-containing protein [Lipomyces kononenkoae]|uniref:CAP Gly-rich domain-containing protein n=1 Tax=Lipomyces kononenkoae TaxID=34357 RepID=A0ACC3T8P0_LIPKO
MADIPLLVTSQNTSSERRVSPLWTLAHLKSRLEPITGIPANAQRLSLFISHSETPILLTPPDGRADHDYTVGEFSALVPFARVHVDDTRPFSSQENYTDVTRVEKFELSQEEYAKRDDTVLAWKKRNQLGRFAETASDHANFSNNAAEVEATGITVGKRCRVVGPSERRGVVKFVGPVPELPSGRTDENDNVWIGVEFDEPVGKNNGTIQGVKYFDSRTNHGSFVRPDKVEVGDFPEINDLFDEDDEEV